MVATFLADHPLQLQRVKQYIEKLTKECGKVLMVLRVGNSAGQWSCTDMQVNFGMD